ncbi:hypothetical protein ACFL0Q_06000 [Thermodesulfobacteriota bacterium]
MNSLSSDPIFLLLGSAPWPLRYALIAASIYLPASYLSFRDGNFWESNERCDICFRDDYTFHIIWLICIPSFLMMIPSCIQEMAEALDILSTTGQTSAAGAVTAALTGAAKGSQSEVVLSPQISARMDAFFSSRRYWLYGAGVGLLVSGGIFVVNLASLKKVIGQSNRYREEWIDWEQESLEQTTKWRFGLLLKEYRGPRPSPVYRRESSSKTKGCRSAK